MASSRPRFVSYRGTVALNNMGVTMLEKSHYKGALASFKEALSILQSSETHGLHSDVLSNLVTASLRDATRRLLSENDKCGIPHMSLHVLTHRTGATRLLTNQVSSDFTFCHTAIPIRVEVEDFDLDPSDREVEYLTAILLINMGVSSFCFSRVCNPELVAQTLNNAIRIFSLAESTLTAIRHKISVEDGAESEAAQYTLQMDFLTLRSVIPLLQATQNAHAANHCVQKLAQVSANMKRIDMLEKTSKPRCASAA